MSPRGVRATVGCNVTLGHMAVPHACETQGDAFIGMNDSVLDGAVKAAPWWRLAPS
jgi:carbonic anhydrase/acetyltransferase-like protein (isoleucine patch superfamily)